MYKLLFQITITPYKRDIEPNVHPKKEVIEAVKKISQAIGKENVSVRYDPIFLSEKYNLNILVELLFLMLVANAVASFAL